VGGRTLGVRAQASRYHLEWSFLGSDLWVVESASKWQFECKGSSISKGKEQGRRGSSSKQGRKGAHSSRGAYLKEPFAKLERSLQRVRFLCIYLSCCSYCLKHSIYIHLSQTGFPRGGFIQGHVDQKYLCSFSCMLEF
jgi:hypothetical protein